jgi:hypothetical protein
MASLKIYDHGYWKSKLFYYQSLLYYSYYILKYRSIVWFSSVNEAIHMGGMLDESKDDLYQIIPSKYLPKTIKVTSGVLPSDFDFNYPVICKPDIGLKGWKVVKINDEIELKNHLNSQSTTDWIVQEYVNHCEEYAVLCVKDVCDKNKINITSLTHKVHPFVIGDGLKSLEQLAIAKNDAYLNIEELAEINALIWKTIPEKDQRITLHNIGNYSRGSKFFNANKYIDESLLNIFQVLMNEMEGIHFCRFDLKTSSLDDLKKGDFIVLEMNGAKSEPLHTYDPSYGWWQSIVDIHNHWVMMGKIANYKIRKEKFKLPTTRQGLEALTKLKRIVP